MIGVCVGCRMGRSKLRGMNRILKIDRERSREGGWEARVVKRYN